MTDENTTNILNMGLESLVEDGKATDDFSAAVKALLDGPVKNLIQQKKLDAAVEEILPLEKKCRQACDAISASTLALTIVKMFREVGNWDKVSEYMLALTKKRGQLRRVTTDLVNLAMDWVKEATLAEKVKEDLMATLNTITDGKIYVEVERARLIAMLADRKEKEGDLDAAAALLQEVQVETFGSMDKHEKARYILNQMRLMLLRKDFIRVQIASRKINEKFLVADDFQEIKLEYYQNMVAYYLDESDYFQAAECYKKMYNTPMVQASQGFWQEKLSCWLAFLLLSVKDKEGKVEAMETEVMALARKHLEAVSQLRDLVKAFQTKKLITWPLWCDKELKELEVFKDPTNGATRFDILKKRVIQHNIRTCQRYYTLIQTQQMMKLLKVSQKELEAEISELVVTKALYARIDRPEGIIRFGTEPKSEDKLNDWAAAIDGVLDLVKEAGHLISKEKMIQEARAKLKKK